MFALRHNLKLYFMLGKELFPSKDELNILKIVRFGFVAEERLLARLHVEDSSPLKPSQNEFAAAKAAEAE
ncbi:MAG: hypothetical protein V7776_16695 [Halopseudomonas aestusnigri]